MDTRIDCELSDSDLEMVAAGLGKRGAGSSAAATSGIRRSSGGGWGSQSAGYQSKRMPAQAPRVSGGNCANGQCG